MMAQVIFILVTIVGFSLAYTKYARIVRIIKMGREYAVTGDVGQRWKNTILLALGQKKMFKRFIPAIFHLFIYVAFLFTQVELIEIIIDGFTGKHRIFAEPLGAFYTSIVGTIEVLSFLAFIATFVFLARRNLLKIPRFQQSEMNGWPKLDANIILLLELVLLVGIAMMNGADVVLQSRGNPHYPYIGTLPVSSWLGPALFGGLNDSSLVLVERTGWWLHYLVVLGFLNYLPMSKHLHIMLAFPNTYYGRLAPYGKMQSMPEVVKEVKILLGQAQPDPNQDMSAIPAFGAKDVMDLTWKNLLDAYSCTECGRCTDDCPANRTGKKLSPRKVMMDVRDRAEEVMTALDKDASLTAATFDDGASLLDRITPEEIFACTTCNACVEACPVSISPLEIILQLRRYEILTLSKGPTDWLPMFTAIENTGAPWQMGTPRSEWTTLVD